MPVSTRIPTVCTMYSISSAAILVTALQLLALFCTARTVYSQLQAIAGVRCAIKKIIRSWGHLCLIWKHMHELLRLYSSLDVANHTGSRLASSPGSLRGWRGEKKSLVQTARACA